MKLSYFNTFNILFFNEEVDTPEVEEETPDQSTVEPEWLKEIVVPYNKEDFSPSNRAELDELIEMGKFYKEKGKEQLSSYKEQQNKIDFINKELEKQGYEDFSKWKSDVDSARQEDAINKIAEEKGYSFEDAKELLEGRTATAQVNAMTAKENESKAQIKARENQVNTFFDSHPDLKTTDLPKEVLDAFDSGKRLDLAYAEHQNAQLKSQLDEIKKIKSNGDVSPGSISGMQAKGKIDINAMSKEDFDSYVASKMQGKT